MMSVNEVNLLTREGPRYRDDDATARSSPSSISKYCQLLLNQITSYLPGTSAQFVYYDLTDPCESTNQNYQRTSQQTHDWRHFESVVQRYLKSEEWLTQLSNNSESNELILQENQRAYIFPIYSSNYSDYFLLGANEPLQRNQRQWVSTQVELFKQHLLLLRAYHQQQTASQAMMQSIRQARHQVQNPLALIELYAAMLNSTVSDESVRSHITHIHEAVQSINLHLQNLSPSGQQRPLKIERYDLQVTLVEVLKELEPWLHEKRMTVQHPSNSLILPVDSWQLKQVFTNLFNNALHFSPEGGTLYCNWQLFRQEVLVEIWDEGVGLSEIDLQNLFVPFYSRRPDGNGLGLTIAQQIVQAHGGRLWAKNMPEKGAKFSFILPR